MDELHRHGGRHQPHAHPPGPGGRRHLRSAGASGHQRGGRGPLVRHRLGPGQPAADRHQRLLRRRHVPGWDHRELQRDRAGRRGCPLRRRGRRHADLRRRGAASRVARREPDRGRRRGQVAGHAPQSGLVEVDLHRHRRLRRVGDADHDHRHHRQDVAEHCRELGRGHGGRRPGNGHALQRGGAELHAGGQGEGLRQVRHRRDQRPDQPRDGRDAGLRDRRFEPGDGDLERPGDRQVLPGRGEVHGRWP